MADVDEKEKQEKAEKLAAAKKKFEYLKKQKNRSSTTATTKRKEDQPVSKDGPPPPSKEENTTGIPGEQNQAEIYRESSELRSEKYDDAVETTSPGQDPEANPKLPHNRQPSLSVQSKMRSSSFRRTSLSQGPLSPVLNGSNSPDLPILTSEGDSFNSIYKKQATRLDELERENKRLAREVQESESRWRKTEEELEELREASGEVAELKSRAQRLDAVTDELTRVKQENTSLQRQNSQLQSQSSKRRVSSPSQANASNPISSLQSQLDSKSSTIESMEMEISNLRTQLNKSSTSSSSQSEQVKALEEKLDRAERAASAAQRELIDARKNLDRASEKAVREGTEKTSNATKVRNLSREAEETRRAQGESLKRTDTLEKKLTALTNMHKDADARRQAGERERERLEKEASEMRRRFASIENDNLRLRDERERARKREASGADDEGLDELEDDERQRLEAKVRDQEDEIYELRRGVWREKRKELQGSMDGEDGPGSPSSKFDDIDLSGPSPYRRQSMAGRQGSSFTTVLSSGISAFTGGSGNKGSDDVLQDFDDDGFNEDAFRLAQEDEARKRIERVKEIKRGLKEWEGWRMDIVDLRSSGGAGVGEIFDV